MLSLLCAVDLCLLLLFHENWQYQQKLAEHNTKTPIRCVMGLQRLQEMSGLAF